MTKRELYDRPTWRCPDEVHLAAYVDCKLDARDRARLERHLAGCKFCLGHVSALARLQEAEVPDVPPVLIARARGFVSKKKTSPFAAAWRWASASAVTACAAILLTVSIKAPQIAAPVSMRASAAYTTTPELLLPRDGARLQRGALEFRWTPMDRALFYEIRVLTADGGLVWETRADGTAARPPATLEFRGGQKYFASVSVWLPEGKAVRSPIVGFQVTDR